MDSRRVKKIVIPALDAGILFADYHDYPCNGQTIV